MPGIMNTEAMQALAYRLANHANTPTGTVTELDANARGDNTDPAVPGRTRYAVQQSGGQHVVAEVQDLRSFYEERNQKLMAKNRRKRYLELHPEYFDDESLELANPTLYDTLIRRFMSAAQREAIGKSRGFVGQLYVDIRRPEIKNDTLRSPNALFAYDTPMSKEEGAAYWKDEMTQRFLRGDDVDFDYKQVDSNDKYNDPEMERDMEEAYFDSTESDYDTDGEGKEKVLIGETGIQDY
jgi:hypothetical protein